MLIINCEFDSPAASILILFRVSSIRKLMLITANSYYLLFLSAAIRILNIGVL